MKRHTIRLRTGVSVSSVTIARRSLELEWTVWMERMARMAWAVRDVPRESFLMLRMGCFAGDLA